jgi:hypothetical protein
MEKTVVPTPLSIHEVYTPPDVQEAFGPDLFKRLIPLSVPVRLEEKSKWVREEVERAEHQEKYKYSTNPINSYSRYGVSVRTRGDA